MPPLHNFDVLPESVCYYDFAMMGLGAVFRYGFLWKPSLSYKITCCSIPNGRATLRKGRRASGYANWPL